MEIHFCDLCNESVPQSDLEQGHAFLRKGRVICATCEELMSKDTVPAATASAPVPAAGLATGATAPGRGGIGAPPLPPPAFGGGAPPVPSGMQMPPAAPPPPRRSAEPVQVHGRSSAGTILAGMLAIASMIFVGGVAWMLNEKIDASQDDDVKARKAQYDLFERSTKTSEERLTASIEEARREASSVNERLGSLSGRFETTSQNDSEALRELRDELRLLSGQLGGLDELRNGQRRGDEAMEQVQQTITGLQDDVVLLSKALLELENRLAGMGPVQPAPPVDEPVAGEEPPWMDLVGDLSSPNSGTRWMAVQDLGETGDPAVLEYLVPMIDDEDLFVRIATMGALGELDTPAAIPVLIDGLEDEETSVRERALLSLRDLSGQNFKFDPQAPKAERDRRIEDWRDWWEKNAEDLLGVG